MSSLAIGPMAARAALLALAVWAGLAQAASGVQAGGATQSGAPLPASAPVQALATQSAAAASSPSANRLVGGAEAVGTAVPGVATAAASSEPVAIGGVQSANILEMSSADRAAAQAARQRTQPLNNAPFWRQVNSGNAYYTSLPGRETGVLIQRGGEPWRQLRNGPVTQWGGLAVVLVILAIAGYHAWRGPQRLQAPRTGRLIERFSVLERAAHRTMSLSFVVLAATGLLMLFGKYVLLPVFGYSLFAGLAALSKNLHNFVGPLFGVSLVVSFIVFVRDNLPDRSDWQWVRHAGGLLGGATQHIPSGKFNAGEKSWFWLGVFVLGAIVTLSGLVLNFPNFEQTRGQMQLAWTVHAIATLLFVCASFGHIYMGLLGVEGAREGMRTGFVDDAWAREHHELWYEEVNSGRIPRVRSRHPDAVGVAAPVAEALGRRPAT